MRVTRWTMGIAMSGMCLGWSALSSAQGLPASEVIKNRIANFREIGTAFKGIGDELKAKEPYMATIQESAQHIESLGSEVLSWFPPGTGPTPEPEKGIIDSILAWFSSDEPAKHEEGKTRAKPAVWTQRATFESNYRKFFAEAKKMNEVAQSGDKVAVAAQFKALGATCKTCHDGFREEKKE